MSGVHEMDPQCIAPAAYSSDTEVLEMVKIYQHIWLLLNSLNCVFTSYYKQAHMWPSCN